MKTDCSAELSAAHCAALTIVLICGLYGRVVWGQRQADTSAANIDPFEVPTSHDFIPHFEEANGRKVLYVEGRPFTVLAVEIPWWDLIYGRYKDTETAYDGLYSAAAKLGVNALKVPI
jgi:hypothetical protein